MPSLCLDTSSILAAKYAVYYILVLRSNKELEMSSSTLSHALKDGNDSLACTLSSSVLGAGDVAGV